MLYLMGSCHYLYNSGKGNRPLKCKSITRNGKLMKITVFEMRKDEKEFFEQYKNDNETELKCISKPLNKNTILQIEDGCECISISGHSRVDEKILKELKLKGVKYISTRTIGYNHINVKYAKEIGISVANTSYPPTGVAEFTIMLMLLAIRNYKPAMWRQNVNDYSLEGLIGREIGKQKVGIIGCGQIARAVIKLLSGFDCEIYIYNRSEHEEMKKYAKFVDMDTLYHECDIISLHIPLCDETYHMINDDALKKMKKGVILINTARGELMDIDTLTRGIETEKIGALGLDVFENENGIYHVDRKTDIISNKDMVYLRQFPNVVMTQHMAFYTKNNIGLMVNGSMESLKKMYLKQECKNLI